MKGFKFAKKEPVAPSPADLALTLQRVIQACQMHLSRLRRNLAQPESLQLLKEHGLLLSKGKGVAEALVTVFEARTESTLRVDGEKASVGHLTPREREVLRRVADGQTSKQMAAELGVTVKAIEAHRSRLMLKLRRHSVAELTRFAIRSGLTAP